MNFANEQAFHELQTLIERIKEIADLVDPDGCQFTIQIAVKFTPSASEYDSPGTATRSTLADNIITDIDVAKVLELPLVDVRGLIRSGAIKGRKFGRIFRVHPDAIAAYQLDCQNGQEIPEMIYSATEVADLLGIDRASIYKMRNRGEIRFVKKGNEVLISKSEADRLAAELVTPEAKAVK